MSIRILFAGTPEIAVQPLETIAGKFTICGVLTSPDKPAGRSGQPIPPAVKRKALDLGLAILQPEKLDEPFREQVKRLAPDVLVVVAFGKLFKQEFLDLFPLGAINMHPSLLPKYRGPSPLQAAILAGDTETGVSIQRLVLKMDAGPLLAQRRMSLAGTETTADLTVAAASLGSELLVTVLEQLAAGTLQETPQDEAAATYCRLIKKEDGLIDWSLSAVTIERMNRAYTPWPGIYTSFKGLTLTILKTALFNKSLTDRTVVPAVPIPEPAQEVIFPPGYVWGIDKEAGILVCTGEGMLIIKELQLQSKKAMDWKAFINGNRDLLGAILGG
jgi:methionyl-tRNA formyltransferase